MTYNQRGLSVKRALEITGMTRHEYYYKPATTRRPPGRKPSTHTLRKQPDGKGNFVEHSWAEDDLLEFITQRCSDPDLHHGYRSMSNYLGNEGFIINRKKVLRIMKSANLLQERSPPPSKTRVKHRRFEVDGPLRGLEMDIKFVFVEEYRRQAPVLSVIDVFTRELLAWHVAYSIKSGAVQTLWERIIEQHLQPADMLREGVDIQIRNDNDPRFSAQAVQDFFELNYLGQVFTHPYTPQENGHIESFHAILSNAIDNRAFLTLKNLEEFIGRYYKKYNEKRVHSSIAGLPPLVFKQQWQLNNILITQGSKGKQRFKLTVPRYTLAPVFKEPDQEQL